VTRNNLEDLGYPQGPTLVGHMRQKMRLRHRCRPRHTTPIKSYGHALPLDT
jgi:hypothetical protein